MFEQVEWRLSALREDIARHRDVTKNLGEKELYVLFDKWFDQIDMAISDEKRWQRWREQAQRNEPSGEL